MTLTIAVREFDVFIRSLQGTFLLTKHDAIDCSWSEETIASVKILIRNTFRFRTMYTNPEFILWFILYPSLRSPRIATTDYVAEAKVFLFFLHDDQVDNSFARGLNWHPQFGET